jgi:hypothetical protein
MELRIGAGVIAKENLPFALSEGIDVPVGTIGIVKEISNGGKFLHVLWKVGGDRGETYYNVNPSQCDIR